MHQCVSKEGQIVENHWPETQVLAASTNFEVGQVFQYKDSVAKTRPEFDAMIPAARSGVFEFVVVLGAGLTEG